VSTVCVMPVRARKSPGLTWADIMADRTARGLEAPRPAPAKRVQAPTGPRSIVIVGGPTVDQRDPRNTLACTAPMHSGGAPKSAAAASKARREAMVKCSCRTCGLALWPPLTFAEHRAFCGVILDAEQEDAVFGGPRVKREHVDGRDSIEVRKSRDCHDRELSVYGPKGCLG